MQWIVKQTKSKGYEFTFDIVKGKAVIGQAHYIPKLLRQGYGIRLNDSKFLLQYMPAADAKAYMRGINTKDILRHPFAIRENNCTVGEISVIHTKTGFLNGSVNVEFKTPSRGGKKSASLKKLKIVKTSNLMHSAWTKVS